jgi:hypothetical protein
MPIQDDHIALIPIHKNCILTRYMDLEKFISLIETKSLYFRRDDKFTDPFEGSIPIKEKEYQEISNQNNGHAAFHNEMRATTVVNCWHINNYESELMWRLYVKTNEGVAIQSNISRITDAFVKTPEILYASKVKYIDYIKDIWYDPVSYPYHVYSSIQAIIHKRKEFALENEFRIFYELVEINRFEIEKFWLSQPEKLGKKISLDVNKLIDKVIFSPNLGTKKKNNIINICNTNGYNF